IAEPRRRSLGPRGRTRAPAIRGTPVPPAVAGPGALWHRPLPGASGPATQPYLLPLPRNRRRVLQVLRPPVSTDRRLADLRRAPARRGAAQDLPDQRRSRPRPTREID